MKFPFFASFIILCLVIRHAISRNSKLREKSENAFWSNESAANDVRKQPLDNLNYIAFSASPILPDALLDSASLNSLMEESKMKEIPTLLLSLEQKKIVNLNYITNTELKAAYGAGNLTLLTEYDQNYTDLITTLQEYASLLAQKGYIIPALRVLETAFAAGTDISTSYSLAASIYKEQGQEEKIHELTAKAEALNSPRKNAIVRMLHKVGPDTD